MKITVIRSAVIDASIDDVWAVLRDFNSHDQWHPAVAGSRMENGLDSDVVGGVRKFSLTSGEEIREQLLRHNDREHAFTYCILDSPLPLLDYVATVQLKPVTDGNQTFWDWRAHFRAPGERAKELENIVGTQIHEAGFTGLRQFLVQQIKPAQPSPQEAKAIKTAVFVGEDLPSRTVVVTSAGKPESLTLENLTVSAPDPEQVRIRQTAIAVNRQDISHCRISTTDVDIPKTPGMEGVGEIIDVGRHVNGFFRGDRVVYLRRNPGSYAEIRCIDADECLPLPEGVTDVEASILLKGLTASLLLNRVFQAATGATILIESVAGGLGHLLSQWARSMELVVIGTVATEEQAKFSRDNGCDHPIVVTNGTVLRDEVMRITKGRGVDYWVHRDGSHGLDNILACLKSCGHCAVIGDCGGSPIPLDFNVLQRRSLTISTPVVFDYLTSRPYLQRIAHQLFTQLQKQTITPTIQTFPLSQVTEAHEQFGTEEAMGAITLTPDP